MCMRTLTVAVYARTDDVSGVCVAAEVTDTSELNTLAMYLPPAVANVHCPFLCFIYLAAFLYVYRPLLLYCIH